MRLYVWYWGLSGPIVGIPEYARAALYIELLWQRKSKLPFRLVLPTKLHTLHIKRAQPFWCFSAVTTRWSSPRPGKGILSAPNPGFGIWDFAWNLATRVKFGTYEQNRNFFEKIDLHRLHMGPEDLFNRKKIPIIFLQPIVGNCIAIPKM